MSQQNLAADDVVPELELARRADLCFRTGQIEAAERYCGRILARSPAQFDALHILGRIRLAQENYQEAIGLLTAATAQDRNVAEAPAELGLALAKLDRHEEALASCKAALAIDPDCAGALTNLALVNERLDRPRDALAAYERMIIANPANAAALNNRARMLEKLGRQVEALASRERALAILPGDGGSQFERGNALLGLGRYREAAEAYDAALKLNARWPEALNNRGVCLHRLGRCEEALASFAQVLVFRFDHAEARFNRGLVFEQLADYPNAIANYEGALAINPAFAEARRSRANLLRRLERITQDRKESGRERAGSFLSPLEAAVAIEAVSPVESNSALPFEHERTLKPSAPLASLVKGGQTATARRWWLDFGRWRYLLYCCVLAVPVAMRARQAGAAPDFWSGVISDLLLAVMLISVVEPAFRLMRSARKLVSR